MTRKHCNTLVIYLSIQIITILSVGCCAQGKSLRMPLPTDKAISVYVGVKAKWESMSSRPYLASIPDTTREILADVSSYELSETPTRNNLTDHEFMISAISKDPEWYAFRPTDDRFILAIDINDSKRRMGSIVISELKTGKIVRSANASSDGYSIKTRFALPWAQPFYRIDGYDRNDRYLFRLGVSHGQPDTYVHFTKTGYFAPHRPYTVHSARFMGGDNIVGVEGDPYELDGVIISTNRGSEFSICCVCNDQINDTYTSYTMQANYPSWGYQKKQWLQTAYASAFHSNDKMDAPSLASEAPPLNQFVFSHILTDIIQPPYSDCTGHWHAKFVGIVTSFFAVPYSVAKHKEVWNEINAAFSSYSLTYTHYKDLLHFRFSDNMSAQLLKQFHAMLSSDSGRQESLKVGMVIDCGEVKTVEIEEVLKEMKIIRPIYQDVTFTLVPDIAPLNGVGDGKIELNRALTTPSPPLPNTKISLTFSAPTWTTSRRLAKGYTYLSSGNFSDPQGYIPIHQSTEFLIPGSTSVHINVVLNVCLSLKIVTNIPCSLVINKENGTNLAKGSTTPVNGENVYLVRNVPRANYNILATNKPIGFPPVSKTAKAGITAISGFQQTVTIELK